MTIQVNIGEAKDRLSQLIAAAERGEEVTIARAGVPAVRITPIDADAAKRELAARRLAFVGSVKLTPELANFDWEAPMSDEELKLFYGDPLPPEFDGLSR